MNFIKLWWQNYFSTIKTDLISNRLIIFEREPWQAFSLSLKMKHWIYRRLVDSTGFDLLHNYLVNRAEINFIWHCLFLYTTLYKYRLYMHTLVYEKLCALCRYIINYNRSSFQLFFEISNVRSFLFWATHQITKCLRKLHTSAGFIICVN